MVRKLKQLLAAWGSRGRRFLRRPPQQDASPEQTSNGAPAQRDAPSPPSKVRLHGTWIPGTQTDKAFYATCVEVGWGRWFPRSHASFSSKQVFVSPWLAPRIYEDFYRREAGKVHESLFLTAVQNARADDLSEEVVYDHDPLLDEEPH